jgi:glycosyltransferase involved in cell wall biosynthesis
MPRVTVILPVRDGGVYLRPAVDSILRQDYPDFELLVVDDHSRDGAVEALPAHARLHCLPVDGSGVSAAFNTGLAHASGELIARMDADDLALPERLSRQVAWLDQHPGVDICGGCVEIFSDAGVQGGNRRYQQWLNACRSPAQMARELFIESPLPNPTAMFRRTVLQSLGGYADPDWPEDYDLFLRADEAGLCMGKPAPTVLRWREHDGRLTRTDKRYARERFQAAKAHYLARRLQRLGRADSGVVIWGAGPTGTQFHDLLTGQGIDTSGFLEVHPRRIGGRKRTRPVWPLDEVERLDGQFIVVAVGAAGARPKIRRFMQRPDWREGENWLFVA